jgi:predicted SprT family Zn-dependent metalloprotease
MSNIAQAIEAVEALLEVADKTYGTSLAGNVHIRCDIRGFRTAGQARCKRDIFDNAHSFELRLHPIAIEQHWEDTLSNTIPHEIAHLVNYAKPSTGRRHDRGWKKVCLALGGNSKRCHSLDLGAPSRDERISAREARRPYVYTDSKGTERRLTKIRHKKLQQTWGGYSLRYRDNGGTIDGNSTWRLEPINVISNAKTPKAPVARKAPAKRSGGQSKADIARRLIKLHFPGGPDQLNQEQIIAKIADVCGLSKGLAKTYFNNNLAKAMISGAK